MTTREELAGGITPYRRGDRLPPANEKIPAWRVVEAMDKAGFPESEWATGVAVARRESALYPKLIGAVNPASWDFGLFQISHVWWSHLLNDPARKWYDPDDNTEMAKIIFDDAIRRGKVGWTPWHTYTGGGYRQYLDMGREGVIEYKNRIAPEVPPHGGMTRTRPFLGQQKGVNYRRWLVGEPSRVAENGEWNLETYLGVRELQRAVGTEDDGYWGPITQRMYDAYTAQHR